MGSPLGESHLFIGAAIGELLTSAVEDEHLDFTDRSHAVNSHGWLVSR